MYSDPSNIVNFAVLGTSWTRSDQVFLLFVAWLVPCAYFLALLQLNACNVRNVRNGSSCTYVT